MYVCIIIKSTLHLFSDETVEDKVNTTKQSIFIIHKLLTAVP
jgi:hypothetical protein